MKLEITLPKKITNAINEMSKEYKEHEKYIEFATELAKLEYSDGMDIDEIIAEVCKLPKSKR